MGCLQRNLLLGWVNLGTGGVGKVQKQAVVVGLVVDGLQQVVLFVFVKRLDEFFVKVRIGVSQWLPQWVFCQQE